MCNNPIPRCKLLLIVIGVLLCATACKKEKGIDPAVAGLKIHLISGGGQTDTIGKKLKDNLSFQLTQDGHKAPKCYVRIETYDCENNLNLAYNILVEDYIGYRPDSSLFFSQWTLNGIVGTQYLKAIVLDSLQQPQDSITVTATAVKSGKGWYISGCSPKMGFNVTFGKLPSGRILTAYSNTTDYPYYSDDEGITWQALKTLPDKYKIRKIITTPLNEVFVGAGSTGVLYSKDGGQTWDKRFTGLPLNSFDGSIYYTTSGKLFAFTINGIFLSSDKGVSWHQITYGLSYYAGFSDTYSLSDGTLFTIHGNAPIISTDGGEGWRPVYTFSSTAYIQSLFVDDNDDIYLGCSGGTIGAGLYVSKDKGQTWKNIYTAQSFPSYDKGIYQINKFNGAYYFYATADHILIKTTDFITYTPIISPYKGSIGSQSENYIVTNNNHYIISTQQYGLQYYVP